MATLTKEQYIREYYGLCQRAICFCNKMGWLGTACEHWKPISDEEVAVMLQYFEKDPPKEIDDRTPNTEQPNQ